jgi:uncharacterized membrane protein
MEAQQASEPVGPVVYNQIAGDRSLERIGALSDGLFAIAMTIIVLEIRVPSLGENATNTDLANALLDLAPQFLTYLLSFLTLGIFWNAQHSQLNYIARGDRHLAWIELAYLAFVALLPFSTSLLNEYLQLSLAFAVYWFNILALGVMLFFAWIYAERAGLVAPGTPPAVDRAIRRRIASYQALYALGLVIGIVVGTVPGIIFVVLVQLNAAIAPRLPILWRL